MLPLARSVPCQHVEAVRLRRPARARIVRDVIINIAFVAAAIVACEQLPLPSRGRTCCFGCGESLSDIARLGAMKLAREAYPEWAREHPAETCPRSIDDLVPYLDRKDTTDPYGSPYVMSCSPEGLVISSPGEDTVVGTADDIRSDDNR